MHRHQRRRKDRARQFISRAGEGGRARGARDPSVRSAAELAALLPHPTSLHLPPAQSEDIKKKAPNRIDTPPPLNKVYYEQGFNPFKSPVWGEGLGLGEGSVIPMNLLQGDLGSTGRADGSSPSSGKQPFSLMIPNKDKRAERTRDRHRVPTPAEVLLPRGMLSPCPGPWARPAPNCSSMAHVNLFPAASCPPHAPSPSPPPEDKP